MTMARIQPFCRANHNNIGFLERIGVLSRTVTERNIASCLFINPFCVTWKSQGVSFKQPFRRISKKF